MPLPLVYTAFHINMAFSSIEEEDRSAVIKQCYWPLLELAEAGFPIGIEATSYSLKAIQALDPEWIVKLKALIKAGSVEFIGSGFTQMIAPLVPPEVTEWNLKLGLLDYEEILGIKPSIALINEQAYAPGLVPLYCAAGFKAIMMDWSEPASHNTSWKNKFAHYPQCIAGAGDSVIPVVWSDAISFQKFQRYAQGEIDADEYLEFLSLQLGEGAKTFPLYTSDAEIFDYRPGRFQSEALQGAISEYERIRLLLVALKNSGYVKLGLPSDALSLLATDTKPVRLETATAPVPVKKQRKYNITRWAVSGRNDLLLNTHCWRVFEGLKGDAKAGSNEWRALCALWASDYRTHITEKRWKTMVSSLPEINRASAVVQQKRETVSDDVHISNDRRFLVINADKAHLILNLYRGMAIQSYGPGKAQVENAGAPARNGFIGTLSHGFYQDIAMGADFYTGHFTFEPAASHKVTDLVRVGHALSWLPEIEALEITAPIKTSLGTITKRLLFYPYQRKLKIEYKGIPLPQVGSLRLFNITLNPRAFKKKHLYYAAHNGGKNPDRHALWGKGLIEIDHGAPVSRLVSATTGLGMTGGYLEFGDDKNYVRLEVDRTAAAGIGMITSKAVSKSFFVRAAVSLQELDETAGRDHFTLQDMVSPLCVAATLSFGSHT
ncbi:glycoside hydrolase family 57 [Kordiimonas pumila]|uniref:Glycoside hydrolase family 57 n=1 Tax=Kordiimonas pumila TaxID=2161677 RepID=A0ABV7D2J0_9PROT|nr:glycoside hydrolase family 57 [Kordiimonas pumila]